MRIVDASRGRASGRYGRSRPDIGIGAGGARGSVVCVCGKEAVKVGAGASEVEAVGAGTYGATGDVAGDGG